MAGLTGFEPAVSCVTGRHVRPLHHSPLWVKEIFETWWALTGSNRRPLACKASALPAELNAQKMVTRRGFEPLHASVKGWCVEPLHQRAIVKRKVWRRERDSNPRMADAI
jgi:hypothetical protein